MARKRIRNKPGNQASNQRKHRPNSSKEDKTDSMKRTNINTISSRITMVSSAMDAPTSSQNTSSDQSKELVNQQNKELKRSKVDCKHKEQKQLKIPCQCDLILPKSNHRVYDSNFLKQNESKFKKQNECTCEEVKNDDLDHLYNKTVSLNLKINENLIDTLNDKKIDNKSDDKIDSKITTKLNAVSLNDKRPQRDMKKLKQSNQSPNNEQIKNSIEEPIKKSKRFQAKYQYIDEDENGLNNLEHQLGNELNNLNELNDRNNNKFIRKCANDSTDKFVKLRNRQIESNKQLETNLMSNLIESATTEQSNQFEISLVNNLEDNNKLAANKLDSRLTDVDQNEILNNKLGQSDFELKSQLNSALNNSNAIINSNSNLNDNLNNLDDTVLSTTKSNRSMISKNSSIKTIASTAIRAKNHSNTNAKKERKTAKVLAIITGKNELICFLFKFFDHFF